MIVVVDYEYYEENNYYDDDYYYEYYIEILRRKRLMKKLKRWVEGNEKGRLIKLEERCFGRYFLKVEFEDE